MIEILLLINWIVITMYWYVAFIYKVVIRKPHYEYTNDFLVKIVARGDYPDVVRDVYHKCAVENKVVVSSKKVDGVKCVVVPERVDYICAVRKGRDIEYARRVYPYKYTLYLDEDSIFDSKWIPEGDIVQFKELPYTDSLIIKAVEAHRLGFEVEKALFERIKPLYLWGGGYAIRRWLEDKVTYDRRSITEDTAFVFAANKYEYDFRYCNEVEIYTQAPPDIWSLVKQRRRWCAGTLYDIKYVDNVWRKAFILYRLLGWALWIPYTITLQMLLYPNYPLLMAIPIIQTFIWSYVGAREMKLDVKDTILITILAPLASYIHSVGALLSLFWKPKTFEVTPKSLNYNKRGK